MAPPAGRRDALYAAALGRFAIPANMDEREMADPRPAPAPVAAVAGPVTFKIVTASTNKDRVGKLTANVYACKLLKQLPL